MALVFVSLRPMGTCSTWTDVLAKATGRAFTEEAVAESHVLACKSNDKPWVVDFLKSLADVGVHRDDESCLLVVNLGLALDRAALKSLSRSRLAANVLVHEGDWALWRSTAATVLTDSTPRRYSTGTKELYSEWRWILDRLHVRDDREFNEATHRFNRSLDALRLLLHQSPQRASVETAFARDGGLSAFQDKLASAVETLGEQVAYLPAAEAESLRDKSLAVVDAVQTALDVDTAQDWSLNRGVLIRQIDEWYALVKQHRSRHL